MRSTVRCAVRYPVGWCLESIRSGGAPMYSAYLLLCSVCLVGYGGHAMQPGEVCGGAVLSW